MKRVALVFGLCLCGTSALAEPSFNCTYAKLPAEMLLCQDEALGRRIRTWRHFITQCTTRRLRVTGAPLLLSSGVGSEPGTPAATMRHA